ncbi:MAG: HRDC domain-containing protein, partial [Haliea sp.]|nr:HRDC domain-containing protein [Haliea sp.]
SVFRQLVARGYLRADIELFGALHLEDQCRPLLRGEETLELRRDLARPAARQQTKQRLPDDIDTALWEALRECRRSLAEAQGIPPYIIFHDRTLQEMCTALPRTVQAFGALSGVGERKREKYGVDFLQVIERHVQGGTG